MLRKWIHGRRYQGASSFQIIALTFLVLILLGTALLMLPIATANHQGASFHAALFTSTSAACVTGLIVHNTATYWSVFGKLVIITLIQIGGLGVITIIVGTAIFRHERIGLRERSLMQQALSAPKIGGIVRSTKFILLTTGIIELLGALFSLPVFVPQFGWGRGILYALFHSISAFCNAGFDLFGAPHPYSSMVAYADNAQLNIVTMLLILIGGIGFTTWIDVQNYKWHLRRYSLQSKIVLTATVILVALPTIYFFFGEFTAFPFKKGLLASLFQSVSPRTAGFNTVNLAKMSDDGKVVTIILMMIGGGTGSTAGGIKMTTIAVLLVTCVAVLLRQRDATIFGRRIGQQTLFNAAAVFTLYQVLCLLAALVISHVEHFSFLTSLFECSSAIATVGLTLGVTPRLHLLSQAILILLMFIGRVGSLTVVFAVSRARTVTGARLPEEQVNVG